MMTTRTIGSQFFLPVVILNMAPTITITQPGIKKGARRSVYLLYLKTRRIFKDISFIASSVTVKWPNLTAKGLRNRLLLCPDLINV